MPNHGPGFARAVALGGGHVSPAHVFTGTGTKQRNLVFVPHHRHFFYSLLFHVSSLSTTTPFTPQGQEILSQVVEHLGCSSPFLRYNSDRSSLPVCLAHHHHSPSLPFSSSSSSRQGGDDLCRLHHLSFAPFHTHCLLYLMVVSYSASIDSRSGTNSQQTNPPSIIRFTHSNVFAV